MTHEFLHCPIAVLLHQYLAEGLQQGRWTMIIGPLAIASMSTQDLKVHVLHIQSN